jgi:hypothetical protein
MSTPADTPQTDPDELSRELEQLQQLALLRQRERDETTQALYEARKRFDAERQQLRTEITELKQRGNDGEEHRLVQEQAQLKRERDELNEEVAELRQQSHELEQCRLEIQQLTESLRLATAQLDALRGKSDSAAGSPADDAEVAEETPPPPARQAEPARAPAAVEAPTPEAEEPKLAGKPRVERAPSALTESAKKPNLPIKPLAKSWQERRRAPRRRGNPIPVVLADLVAEDDTLGGWVTDRSAGGLRLLVDQELTVGQHFNVRSTRAADAPWIEIEIKHCHNDSGSWSVGCQFVKEKELTWQNRQQFG